MSINVTVTGNPISIKRGKMVTSDSYQAKKEQENRRLIRLQQVRQQSKEIAEKIRNKVRKEKEKQMQQIEQEGKQKLKHWQNKKLLELKTQYEEALQELGTGHKEAAVLGDETDILDEQKGYNDKVATIRGNVAATKLQIEKNKENIKKATPIQQKKIVRDIENTRASLVSGIRKNSQKDSSKQCSNKSSKQKKSPLANINITVPCSSSETSEPDLETEAINDKQQVIDNEEGESSSGSCNCMDVSDNRRQPLRDAFDINNDSESHKSVHRKELSTGGNLNFAKEIHKRRNLIEDFRQKSDNVSPLLDTRISDRIKRRELMASQPDYCDLVAKTHPTPLIESNTQLRDVIYSRNVSNDPVDNSCVCGHKCPKTCGTNLESQKKLGESDVWTKAPSSKSKEFHSEADIPEKPPVKLKDTYNQDREVTHSKNTLGSLDSHKVSYYDHPNRFNQDRQIPSNAHVEKITTDSLEVVPNTVSEREWHEKMKQRDREAQIRGQKALEKERIQRDYEEMLKKLPLLQKKERICEIAKDKQEYHMSEERLKELERKKQNELDNAYSKLFPNLKPAVVTLPSKKHENLIETTDDPIQSLNVGKWDVDNEEQKMFTAEEVQEIVRAFTEQKPKDRRAKLKQLLRSLKLQKEQLINEMKTLPCNDSINELISDLRSFSDSDERTGKSRKRDRKLERKRQREKESSAESTSESTSSSSKYDKSRKTKEKKGTKTPSPKKKPKIKYKQKVLILQNTSTQTTPKIEPKVQSSSSENKRKSDDILGDKEKICQKLHIPCDCKKSNESTDEVCQIVIKINENETPEVVVKSKEKDIVTEMASKEKSPKQEKIELKSIGVGTEVLKETKIDKGVSNIVSQRSSVEDKSKKTFAKKHGSDSKQERIGTKPSLADTTDSKAKSWRDQLSKNSISSSSTSYFSPPDFHKTLKTQTHSSTINESKHSLYHLRKKPQQTNLRDVSLSLSSTQTTLEQQTTDSRLLVYIQQLLSMSRGSIENLTASTSSVQTPSQSVIEMESNNPLAQLHDVIKYFNLKDVRENLSYSPDHSSIHYNTSASTPEMLQPQQSQDKSVDLGTDVSKSSNAEQKVKETSSSKSRDSVLAQYADITDSCSRRIAQLAEMIQQLREEKLQMLQNPPGPDNVESMDKDYSTAYLELPVSNDSSSKYSSVNSQDEEELQKKLLEIDFSLAEKLRQFSKRTDDKPDADELAGTPKNTIESNSTNAELWSRLKRLQQQDNQANGKTSNIPVQTTKDSAVFVPFLSDIPKLPKLEAQLESTKTDLNSSHKRPPPSKGLSVAKKFNGNISLVPHELSTIVEADSQLSTKLGGSANTSRTSQDISPRKDFELIINPEQIVETSKSSSKMSPGHSSKSSSTCKPVCDEECTKDCAQVVSFVDKSQRAPVNLSLESSSPSVLVMSQSTASKKSIQLSSSSSDDMDAIESMLRSIGMEWAIPTLHKTKEALALTSSSSSLELGSKKQEATSGSEVSLKQFLKKQIKISSSTLKSDASPSSFSGELSELSSIQVNNSQADKSNQRTSTPIISSKSTEKSAKKVIFSDDSDISSVRNESRKHSDKSSKYSFHSLSDYSQSRSDR